MPTNEHPMTMYGNMIMNGNTGAYDGRAGMIGYSGSGGVGKHYSSSVVNEPIEPVVKFNDFDDESGNYYMGTSNKYRIAYGNGIDYRNLPCNNKIKLLKERFAEGRQQYDMRLKRVDTHQKASIMSVEDEETFDDVNDIGGQLHKRVKRQVYHQSSYENEEPCHGFPLEINVKSRIKMDQLFPIKGNSQFKKCIKL